MPRKGFMSASCAEKRNRSVERLLMEAGELHKIEAQAYRNAINDAEILNP